MAFLFVYFCYLVVYLHFWFLFRNLKPEILFLFCVLEAWSRQGFTVRVVLEKVSLCLGFFVFFSSCKAIRLGFIFISFAGFRVSFQRKF